MGSSTFHGWLGTCVILAVTACLSPGVFAATPANPYTRQGPQGPIATRPTLPHGPDARAPFGYISFCMRFTDQCPIAIKQAPPVATWRYWPQMVLINQRVNRAIKPESARRHYGRAQYWTIPQDGFGDCVDYALTKRRDLARAGIPLSDLNLAIVALANNKLHAVLVVSTADGDYVLDNLRTAILPWNRTGYVFLSRMSATSRTNWVKVGPRPTIERLR